MSADFNGVDIVDVARQLILTILVLTSPFLAVSLISGLISGFLQAATHIQDQSLSFVPKLIGALITLAVLAPWVIQYLSDYSIQLFSERLAF